MTIPVAQLGPRNPADQGYARVQLGPNWLPSVQSPTGATLSITQCTAVAIPGDVTIAAETLIGTDFYLKPTGGTSGLTYEYALSITLSDGQFFQRSAVQMCVGTL